MRMAQVVGDREEQCQLKMDGKAPATKVPRVEAADEDSREADGSDEQQQMLEKVLSVQNEIDQLNERASEEILHVEQKYNKLRQPFFEKRSELIKNIPDFWSTTLLNNPNLSEMITEEDESAFQYLSNLVVVEYEDVKSGFKISFYFKPNPYFTNDVLSKEIIMESPGEMSVDGTEIKWKPGKDLTSKDAAEMKGRKRGLEETPSFFMWFSDTESTSDPIAEIIKDDIWPNPLQFFLGGGELNETYEEEEEEEGEGEEEELDDEDDDDEPEEVVLSDEEDEDEDDG